MQPGDFYVRTLPFFSILLVYCTLLQGNFVLVDFSGNVTEKNLPIVFMREVIHENLVTHVVEYLFIYLIYLLINLSCFLFICLVFFFVEIYDWVPHEGYT